EDAAILQRPEAHVVRGERKPGSVRLEDTSRNLVANRHEISSTAEDTGARIQTVLHPERTCGLLGEHHQPAHASRRSRERIPMRFLVPDRSQQTPIDAHFRSRFAKPM